MRNECRGHDLVRRFLEGNGTVVGEVGGVGSSSLVLVEFSLV